MAVAVADLRNIMEVPVDKTDQNLQPYVDWATTIATEDLAAKGFSSTRLDQITLALAAHFATVGLEHGGLTTEKIGNSSESYRQIGSNFTGFATTPFGQQALALDTSGTLQAMSTPSQKALFKSFNGLRRLCNGDRGSGWGW